jgi:hypothetical protein
MHLNFVHLISHACTQFKKEQFQHPQSPVLYLFSHSPFQFPRVIYVF